MISEVFQAPTWRQRQTRQTWTGRLLICQLIQRFFTVNGGDGGGPPTSMEHKISKEIIQRSTCFSSCIKISLHENTTFPCLASCLNTFCFQLQHRSHGGDVSNVVFSYENEQNQTKTSKCCGPCQLATKERLQD